MRKERMEGGKILCSRCNVPAEFTKIINDDNRWAAVVCDNCGYRWESDCMIDNIFYRYYYEKKCSCGAKAYCTTQAHHNVPNIYTAVGIPCAKCKEIVWFELPVG